MTIQHGGNSLVDHLAARGVKRVFSVPGESFLAALDALADSGIENIVCRQEGGAAMMAEAHGKLTGAPGVLFVTRGPGATNASSGIHVAMHDATPMLILVGLIPERHRDRGAFQEFDVKAMFGPLAKWAGVVSQTNRIPEYIDRAFAMTTSGRPGPVVLGLPEDVLSAPCDAPVRVPSTFQALPEAANFCELAIHTLGRAKRPLIIVGGSGWSQEAAQHLEQFAAAMDLPVAASFRRQDYMDNRHPNYVGDLGVGINPKLAGAVRKADCIFALGTRLGDITTGSYDLLDPAMPGKTLIHVHPDGDEIGHVYPPQLSFVGPAAVVVRKLARSVRGETQRRAWTAVCRDGYRQWQDPVETPGKMKLEQAMCWLSENLPEDAIVTNGAGNYAGWLHRYFQFKQFGTQLAPTSGSMGYGLPAAIAAKLQFPERTVVCIAGDGCLQMTINELSTAKQFGVQVVILVVNNGRYGTIRMHQEKTYPTRVSGTDLANPDFAALARAYGGYGEAVKRTEDFPGAFGRARGAGSFAILDLSVDVEALSTGETLTGARQVALARQGE
ncbi:thiamine pyrophosphate-binding protein [Alphaproteobacteria bacterium KMM 3653]|uniref:Thiamine pyrophosphate-binding protein n=1 Tax=Harenicola maris TaxID=2841044 RepID=A0AAP2G5M5_9RHOB|nr:thiamine pyrophosphate-binding protein [Harenicola maris]